jgi:hypothetical protein
MYKNKTSTKMLVIFHIFIKGIQIKWENLFLEPHFATTTPLSEWAALIWGFAMPILYKQVEVMIQKLL